MKKIILLMVLCVVIFSSIANAEENQRWVGVCQKDGETIAYLDSNTAKLYQSNNGAIYVNCWIKNFYPKNSTFNCTISHYYFKLSRNFIYPYLENEVFFYDSNGNTTHQTNNHEKGWNLAVPGSIIENIIMNTFTWTTKNTNYIGKGGPTTNIDD